MSNDRLRIPVKSSIDRDLQDASDHGLLRRWWGFLTRAPDDFMLEVGMYGEILVARARLMICGLLEIVPFVFLLYGSGEEITVALVGNTSALIYAIIIYQVVKRGYRNFSLRLFTTVVDISLGQSRPVLVRGCI